MIDVTELILPQLLDEESIAQSLEEHRASMHASAHPQAAVMFIKMAAHQTYQLKREQDQYHDFLHAMNFKALVTCLVRYVDDHASQSFDDPPRPDQEVRRLFARQLMEETNLHQAACMKNGLRRAYWNPDTDAFVLRLTKRRRYSALSLIDPQGQFELLDDEYDGRISREGLTPDEAMKAFTSANERIRFVRDAHPGSWSRFEREVCSADELTAFSAFLHFLDFADEFVGYSLIFDLRKLSQAVAVFNRAYPEMSLDEATFKRLLELFSLDPATANDWLLPVPFLRMSDRFLRYDGFNYVMSGAIGLLTIAIRKNEKLWSETVGSTLAFAADVLAKDLPSFSRLAIAVRRKIKGKGDIDLAVYDTVTRHLFVCEVKTVYDKHGTPLHMHRFEEAKVKLAHAVNQLRESKHAVEDSQITMQALFGRKLPPPLKVSAVLLTWFDVVDLTVGTHNEDVMSMNFATFRVLLRACEGELDVFQRTVNELRNIWCLSAVRQIDLQTKLPTFIEEPVIVFDRLSDFDDLDLSSLTRSLVEQLPHRPEEPWAMGEELVSYMEETRASLNSLPQIRTEGIA